MKRISLQLNVAQIKEVEQFVHHLGPDDGMPGTVFLLADVRYETGEVKIIGWANNDARVAQENMIAAVKKTMEETSDTVRSIGIEVNNEQPRPS